MKSNPHVVFVVSWYKDEKRPSLGSFFEEQARAMQSAGCKVAIISLEYLGMRDKRRSSIEKREDNGLLTWKIRHKNRIPFNRKLSYKRFGDRFTDAMHHYEKAYGKTDILHIQSCFYAGIGALPYVEQSKTAMLITEHFTGFVEGRKIPEKDLPFARKVFRKAHARLAVSDALREAIIQRLELKDLHIDVVPNMVDDRFFALTLNNAKDQNFKFFSNGHLVPRKNFKLLVKAFGSFLKRHPKAELRIAGDGTERMALEGLVTALNLKEKVVFLGTIDREAIANELANCHCYIQTSSLETFGVAMAEALAAGRPVISTKSKGPESFINDSNGVLCDHTEKSITGAMFKLVDDYSRYRPQEIRESCRAFSKEVLISNLMNVYSSILST